MRVVVSGSSFPPFLPFLHKKGSAHPLSVSNPTPRFPPHLKRGILKYYWTDASRDLHGSIKYIEEGIIQISKSCFFACYCLKFELFVISLYAFEHEGSLEQLPIPCQKIIFAKRQILKTIVTVTFLSRRMVCNCQKGYFTFVEHIC